MRCPKCGTENPAYAVVCEHCGEFLPKEDPLAKTTEPILDPNAEKRIRCAYCWHSNPAENEFCEVCGMPLGYVPYPEAEGDYTTPTREDLLPKVMPNQTPDNPVPNGMVRCRKCWHDNPEDAFSCEFCGFPLRRDMPEEEPVEGTPAQAIIPKVVPNRTPNNPVPNGKIRCRSCWHDNPSTATSCESCGVPLQSKNKKRRNREAGYDVFKELRSQTIQCQGCGTSVPWNTMTCPVCGLVPRVGGVYDPDSNRGGGGFWTDTFHYIFNNGQMDLKEEERAKQEEQERIEQSKLRGTAAGVTRGKTRCLTCWTENPSGVTSCRNCGSPLRIGVTHRNPKSRYCECGYVNEPGATICVKCRGYIKKKCPSCGFENLPGVTICAKCGVRLSKPKKTK